MDSVLTDLRAAVTNYVMPQKGRELLSSSHILMICGVTAAGKNTVVHYLIEHAEYEYVVSHTTRVPRENHGVKEENGVTYWFVNNQQMLALVHSQAFVEVKAIHGDTFYGTSITSIEHAMRNKKRPVSEIDVFGAVDFTKAVPSLQPIFILPPNYDIWMERLGTRGFMSEGEKERRLNSAKSELKIAIENPAFVLMVNNEVEMTAAEIINGVDNSSGTQADNRALAQELLDYIK